MKRLKPYLRGLVLIASFAVIGYLVKISGLTGLFDETYWMYGEDLDLCLRVREAGWRARYVPSVVVTHLKGQSSRRRPLRCTYEFYRAMMVFHWKHRARDASPAVNIAVSAGIVCLGAVAIVRDRLRPPARRHVS